MYSTGRILRRMALKAMTPFMTKLLDRLLMEKGLSESTAQDYIQTLYKLNGNKPFRNMTWTKDYEAVDANMDGLAESTKLSYYKKIASVLSLLKTYKAQAKHYNDKTTGKFTAPSSAKTEKQEKNWISQEDVILIKKRYADAVKQIVKKKEITDAEYNVILDYTVLSLYTDIPPRRNKDYADMEVVAKLTSKMPDDRNYYDLSTGKFIFNAYKTAKIYGKQELDVPPALADTIALYLTYHPEASKKALRSGVPLLVQSDGTRLHPVNGITRVLNRVFSRNVGSSMLRHIFLSGKYGGAIEERENDATAMGHSTTAQTYYIQK